MQDHKEGGGGARSPSHHSEDFYVLITEFVSAFGDRMWQFAIPLLFMDVWPTTLLPTILYSFVLNTAMFLLMPLAGSWIDSWPRLPLQMMSIVVDNVCVTTSCVLLFATTYYESDSDDLWLIFVGITCVCIPGQLFVNVGRISLEKDWVPVISRTDKEHLTLLNSRLKMIDLSCKFVAPMAFGFAMQAIGTDSIARVRFGSVVVMSYNVLAAIPECFCVSKLHGLFPELATAPKKRKVSKNHWVEICNGWRTFLSHPICLAATSFSLLFATVLSPGSLLIAFLKWVGVMEGALGASIGMGALFGLLGAWLYPMMRGKTENGERMSLATIGLVSIWMWFITLSPIAFLMLARRTGVVNISGILMGYLILVFVVIGRIWLWSFDLAENQLVQELVGDSIRGQISGVQTALCQLFTVVIYAFGLLFHRPAEFYVLCYASVWFVLVAALCFSLWYYRYRDTRVFYEKVPINIQDVLVY